MSKKGKPPATPKPSKGISVTNGEKGPGKK